MKLALFVLLTVTAAIAVRLPVRAKAASPTFGQLAAASAAGKWNTMVTLFPNLSNTTLPNNTALDPLRAAVMDIRDVLDIFPFCYPTPAPGSNATDVWKSLRDDLNDGYTLIGDYEDLKDVNYSVVVQQQMLEQLLAWQVTFMNHTAVFNYEPYFDAPVSVCVYNRSEKELSSMFWGNSTILPNASMSGNYNLAMLQLAMIQHHYQRYFVLMSFPNLTLPDYAGYMHDYKKQLRAMKLVPSLFPQILNSSSAYYGTLTAAVTATYNVLSQTHGTYVVPFLYYWQYGPADVLAYCEIQLDAAYYTMKKYLIEHAWLDWLHMFQAIVIVPSS